MSYYPRHPFQRTLDTELPPSISGAPAYSARNAFAALYQQELPPSISGAAGGYGARNPFLASYQQELPPSISGWGPFGMAACFQRCRCGRPVGHAHAPNAQYGAGPQMANYGNPYAGSTYGLPQAGTFGPAMGPTGQPFPAQQGLTPAQVAQAAAMADPGPPGASEEIPSYGGMGTPQQTVAGIGAAFQRAPNWQQSAAHQAAQARINAALAARQQYYGAGGSNPFPSQTVDMFNQFANSGPTNPYGQGAINQQRRPYGTWGGWTYPR